MKRYLIEPASNGNPATMWDYSDERRERYPHWTEAVEVRLGSGNVALMHPDDAKALAAVINYGIENEHTDYQQVGDFNSTGKAIPHIYHSYKRLTQNV